MAPHVDFQPSLFDAAAGAVALDRTFATLERIHLDEASWVDYAPGWVRGSDALFADIGVHLTTRRRG